MISLHISEFTLFRYKKDVIFANLLQLHPLAVYLSLEPEDYS